MSTVTALAHPNIAFIKYWGNRDHNLRLPVNGSLSMNLDGLHTQTTVTLDAALPSDEIYINGKLADGAAFSRVTQILDLARDWAGTSHRMRVESANNFPTGAGIASSAAAFAALALAASHAAGLTLNEAQLSRLARRGSGSAARSIPAGFVQWQIGSGDEDSYAFSIAAPDHWQLTDCVAIVAAEHKKTGSTEGHALADSSPLQIARVQDAPRRLALCRQAILTRDFEAFARVTELDSDMMHAVMMTSSPALFYWQPATLTVMAAVRTWRAQGVPVAYTIDAGPNVHVLCAAEYAAYVAQNLSQLSGVHNVLTANVGGAARLISSPPYPLAP